MVSPLVVLVFVVVALATARKQGDSESLLEQYDAGGSVPPPVSESHYGESAYGESTYVVSESHYGESAYGESTYLPPPPPPVVSESHYGESAYGESAYIPTNQGGYGESSYVPPPPSTNGSGENAYAPPPPSTGYGESSYVPPPPSTAGYGESASVPPPPLPPNTGYGENSYVPPPPSAGGYGEKSYVPPPPKQGGYAPLPVSEGGYGNGGSPKKSGHDHPRKKGTHSPKSAYGGSQVSADQDGSQNQELNLGGNWAVLAHGVAGHFFFTKYENGTYEGHSYFDTAPLPEGTYNDLKVFQTIKDFHLSYQHNAYYLSFRLDSKLFFGLVDHSYKWISGHYVDRKKDGQQRYSFDATRGAAAATPSWDKCTDANPFTVLSFGFSGILKLCSRHTQINGHDNLVHSMSLSHKPLPEADASYEYGLTLKGEISSTNYGHYFFTELEGVVTKPKYYFLIDSTFETLAGGYIEHDKEYPFNGAVGTTDKPGHFAVPEEFYGTYSVFSDGYAGTLELPSHKTEGFITYQNAPISYRDTVTETPDDVKHIEFSFDQYGWWIRFERPSRQETYFGVIAQHKNKINIHGHFTSKNGDHFSFDASKI